MSPLVAASPPSASTPCAMPPSSSDPLNSSGGTGSSWLGSDRQGLAAHHAHHITAWRVNVVVDEANAGERGQVHYE